MSGEVYEVKKGGFTVFLRVTYYIVKSSFTNWYSLLGVFVISLINVLLRFVVLSLIGSALTLWSLKTVYENYLQYVVVGFILSTWIAISLEAFYDIFSSHYWDGAFDVFMSTPLGIKPLVVGELISRYVASSVYVLVLIAVGKVVFGVDVTVVNPFLLLVVLVLGTLIALGIGMVITLEFTLLKNRGGSLFLKIFEFLDTFFSGVIIPVEALPGALQCISVVMPFKYYYNAVRMLLGVVPYNYSTLMSDLVVLVAMCAIVLPIGFVCLIKGVEYADRKGSLYVWD